MTPPSSEPSQLGLFAPEPSQRMGDSAVRPQRGERAVVVGTEPDVARIASHPAASQGEFSIVAVLPFAHAGADGDAEDHPLRLFASADEMVTREGAGIIVVAGEVGQAAMRALADVAIIRDCRLLTLIPTDVLPGYRPEVVWQGSTPLIQLARPPHPLWQRGAKRAIDVIGASMGLCLAAPLLMLIMAAIRLESPGVALFRHRRVGLRGRSFSCLKLRTMRRDAEALLDADPALKAAYRENHYKLPDDQDPRVTRLGRFLRRTSLDELPQLWNVLVGDMALVGPRPVVPGELEHYAGMESLLLSVRPGLTGEWAANGRHHVGYPHRAALELRYARTWSLRGDLAILFKTVRAVTDYGYDRTESVSRRPASQSAAASRDIADRKRALL